MSRGGGEGLVFGWSELSASAHLPVIDGCTNPNPHEDATCDSHIKKAAGPDMTGIEHVTQEHANTKCEEIVPHEVKELQRFLD